MHGLLDQLCAAPDVRQAQHCTDFHGCHQQRLCMHYSKTVCVSEISKDTTRASLVSEPHAMKSWSTLSPTKFFSLVWPLKVREGASARASHMRSVESVDALTTSLPARKRTYETALRCPAHSTTLHPLAVAGCAQQWGPTGCTSQHKLVGKFTSLFMQRINFPSYRACSVGTERMHLLATAYNHAYMQH